MRRLFFALCIVFGFAGPVYGQVTVSAAISLKEVMTEVGNLYAKETGQKVQFNFGASGHLLAQIREGAPMDVFIAAADQQMDDAQSAGLVVADTRRVIAGNELVLIVPTGAEQTIRSFTALRLVKRLAIGQPKTVPAGAYATEVLEHLNLTERTRDRIVYGESVRQVLEYVARGEVDAGIVYRTDAQEAGDKVRVVATAKPEWHRPIRYPAVVVKASGKTAEANALVDYLAGEKAQSILASHGFEPATASATRPSQ